MVALNHWNNLASIKEKMKDPGYKKPVPGPGHYLNEASENYRKIKSFSLGITKTGFGVNSDRKIHQADPV